MVSNNDMPAAKRIGRHRIAGSGRSPVAAASAVASSAISVAQPERVGRDADADAEHATSGAEVEVMWDDEPEQQAEPQDVQREDRERQGRRSAPLRRRQGAATARSQAIAPVRVTCASVNSSPATEASSAARRGGPISPRRSSMRW
jgi:hypothetical protein